MPIVHPLIKPDSLEEREYQVTIARKALERPMLVVIPTGMGKTVIALQVIAHRLHAAGGRVLFLAPTKPLVEQHAEFLREFLAVDPDDIILFTGAVPPQTRRELWKDRKVIVSTPQVIQNDLVSRTITLDDVTLIVYDEAHRGVGNYAYVFVQEMYERQGADRLMLGLTASPGSTRKHISEVCRNLGFVDTQIRSEEDEDVAPYVQDVRIRYEKVGLPPELREVARQLGKVYDVHVRKLRALGVIPAGRFVSKKDLLAAQKRIQTMLARGGKRPTRRLYDGMSAQAAAMKVSHAMDLAETQGMYALSAYLERLKDESTSRNGSKASRAIMKDRNMQRALTLSRTSLSEHPKLRRLTDIIRDQMAKKEDSSIIAFTHYRDVVDLVVTHLARYSPQVRPVKFIGQASRGKVKGLTQKEQVETIKRFRAGEFNVLVATSVAEEGLDIPQTDMVLFYEPVPSEIRTIQRRGRTGRTRAGEVVILITKDTRDETHFWSSKHKEERMHRHLRRVGEGMRGSLDFHTAGPAAPAVAPGGGPAMMMDGAGDFPAPPLEGEPDDGPVPGAEPDWTDAEARGVGEVTGGGEALQTSLGPGQARRVPAPVTPPAGPPVKGGTSPTVTISDTTEEGSGEGVKTSAASGGGGRGQLDLDSFGGTGSAPADGAGDGAPAEAQTEAAAPPPPSEVLQSGEDGSRLEIVVDHREYNSDVVRQLARMDITVKPTLLEVGDYVISERVVVERKEVVDFLRSLKDGRLFTQLRRLRDTCQRPVLVVEGKGLTVSSGLNPESVRGALASVVTDLNIAVLTTADGRETAQMLGAMARRERAQGRRPGLRAGKGAMNLRDRQQFIVEGLPAVSSVIAQRLLDHFGSVRAVMNASQEELCQVHGVGAKTAAAMQEALGKGYLRDLPIDPADEQGDTEG